MFGINDCVVVICAALKLPFSIASKRRIHGPAEVYIGELGIVTRIDKAILFATLRT
jgi:hypothetical protein